MSITDLVESDIPDMAPGEGSLVCEQCGDHFEHIGRGRKPKKCPTCRESRTASTPRASSRRTTSKDVESAIAVLDGMYSTASLGLMMLNPRAAVAWAGQIDQLQAQNRVTLAGDAALTKSINRLGERTGKAAFFLSHVFAIAPVVMVIREDMPKRKAKPAEPEPDPDFAAYAYAEPTADDVTSKNLRFFGAE